MLGSFKSASGASRLFLKFLFIVVPAFVAWTSLGLLLLAGHNVRDADQELIARVGSVSGSMAYALEAQDFSTDKKVSQLLLNTVLTDRAIECAVVRNTASADVLLKAPQGIGCKGLEGLREVSLALHARSALELVLKYSTKELAALSSSQRDLNIVVLASSILIAVLTSFIGFKMIIGTPLSQLLAAIRSSAENGVFTKVEKITADELGMVSNAFNNMQDRAELLFKEARQQRDELQTILDNMPQSVMWVDSDGSLRMRSGRAPSIHGISEEDYRSVKSLRDHVRQVGQRGDLGPFESARELEKLVDERLSYLCEGWGPDSSWKRIHFKSLDRYIQVKATKLPDGGVILGQVDITGQVKAEKELEAAQAALEMSNQQLEARVEERTAKISELQKQVVERERKAVFGELVGKFCHELGNPLNGLTASMKVIEGKAGSEASPSIARANRFLERCNRLIHDFHDFSMAGETRPRLNELSGCIQKLCAKAERLGSVPVEFSKPDGEVWLIVDLARMETAVGKIIDNAVQAAAGNTSGGAVKVKLTEDVGRVIISVSDNGAGIADEIFSRVMDPLFSTRGFGAGLGLPIARQCLEQHNGKLLIETKSGQGTTVKMSLPLSNAIRYAA